MTGSAETPYVREPGYAARYRDERFRKGTGPRTHAREVAAIRALLARAPVRPGPWLDVPSGAGRLASELPGAAVEVDRDHAMVAASDGTWRLCARAASLPFTDCTFAGALSMRLMQHLGDARERIAVLAEIRRVTDGPVIVSFFEAASWPNLRRAIRRRRGRRNTGRQAIGWRQFRAELAAAGLRAVAWRPLARFLSEQWLVLAVPADSPPRMHGVSDE